MNVWPTCRACTRSVGFPVLTVLAISVIHSFSPMTGLLLFPFGLLAVSIWMIVMLSRAAAAVWRRSLWDSCRRLAFVALAMPLAVAAFLSGDYVHLAVMYPVYANQISSLGGMDEVAFDWGGTGFTGSANSERALVYDPKGAEVGVKPLAAEPAVSVATNRLLGHFYIREMSW
jgi:hypothetical protein